jgi:hypothetical protein
VKFQRPNYVFWKGSAELKDLKSKQFEFVEKLGTIMREEAYEEIIYLDETTFNLWQKTSKCWLRPGMKLRMPCNRGPSITVIGTISNKRGLIHLEVFQGTNNATIFHQYMARLKAKCIGRTIVILDNLKIHHSKLLETVYDSNFKEMLLPPYSSSLNPIERLWSLIKRQWQKELHRFTQEVYGS